MDENDGGIPAGTPAPPPSGTGCVECEADGSWWVNLRRCVECGHVGCCDSSLGKHATAHYAQTGHRYIRTFEPGQDWYWDYQTQTMVTGIPLPPPQHHPLEQPTPGPADRVPAGWQDRLAQG